VPFCEFCGEEIGYLPFRCNYCGGTFCKQHRLPENHECTFELKHKPVVPTTPKRIRHPRQESKRPASKPYLEKGPKELKKYLKRQEKQREDARRIYERATRRPGELGFIARYGQIVYLIIAITILSFIVSVFWPDSYLIAFGPLPVYIWRIFVAPFVYLMVDSFDILFFGIYLIFFYMIGRRLEMRYGIKYVVKLFIICELFKLIFFVLLRLLLAFISPINWYYEILIPYHLTSGAFFGLIAFIILPLYNVEFTAILYFIPVRMKGKSFLFILIILSVLQPLFLYIVYNDVVYFAIYLSDLGGIFGAYLVVSGKIKLRSGRF